MDVKIIFVTFCVIRLHSLVGVYQRFGGICFIHFQGSLSYRILKIEAAGCSEYRNFSFGTKNKYVVIIS
jgi:hypothetical protein